QKGQPDEAIEQFQKALGINPNYVKAHSNLGVALFQKGELDEAIAQFQKAVEINPDSFAIHYNLGNALFQKGQLDEAITQFQEVLRLKPDFSPAQDNLAKAAQALVGERGGRKSSSPRQPVLFSKDSRWTLVFSLTIGVRGWHKLPKIVGMACMWVYRRR